ncbi:hypothetical protein NMY22_g10098 [Coprinellus aureogranulatus]|nr:hypothetical protein NMY22_g10098 [Coprinellus aureogranulatus]
MPSVNKAINRSSVRRVRGKPINKGTASRNARTSAQDDRESAPDERLLHRAGRDSPSERRNLARSSSGRNEDPRDARRASANGLFAERVSFLLLLAAHLLILSRRFEEMMERDNEETEEMLAGLDEDLRTSLTKRKRVPSAKAKAALEQEPSLSEDFTDQSPSKKAAPRRKKEGSFDADVERKARYKPHDAHPASLVRLRSPIRITSPAPKPKTKRRSYSDAVSGRASISEEEDHITAQENVETDLSEMTRADHSSDEDAGSLVDFIDDRAEDDLSLDLSYSIEEPATRRTMSTKRRSNTDAKLRGRGSVSKSAKRRRTRRLNYEARGSRATDPIVISDGSDDEEEELAPAKQPRRRRTPLRGASNYKTPAGQDERDNPRSKRPFPNEPKPSRKLRSNRRLSQHRHEDHESASGEEPSDAPIDWPPTPEKPARRQVKKEDIDSIQVPLKGKGRDFMKLEEAGEIDWMPLSKKVDLVPLFGSKDAPEEEALKISQLLQLYQATRTAAYLKDRLMYMTTFTQQGVLVNPARARLDRVTTNQIGTSTYFVMPSSLVQPRPGALPFFACFLMTGVCAYSFLFSDATKIVNQRTIVDHRIGLYPIEWEYQRAMTYLGNVAKKNTLRYSYTSGVMAFSSKIEGIVCLHTPFICAQSKAPSQWLGATDNSTNFGASPNKSAFHRDRPMSQTSVVNPALEYLRTSRFPTALSYNDTVPIFDARNTTFLNGTFDLAALHTLPLIKTEVEESSVVTVGFTSNTYVYTTGNLAGHDVVSQNIHCESRPLCEDMHARHERQLCGEGHLNQLALYVLEIQYFTLQCVTFNKGSNPSLRSELNQVSVPGSAPATAPPPPHSRLTSNLKAPYGAHRLRAHLSALKIAVLLRTAMVTKRSEEVPATRVMQPFPLRGNLFNGILLENLTTIETYYSSSIFNERSTSVAYPFSFEFPLFGVHRAVIFQSGSPLLAVAEIPGLQALVLQSYQQIATLYLLLLLAMSLDQALDIRGGDGLPRGQQTMSYASNDISVVRSQVTPTYRQANDKTYSYDSPNQAVASSTLNSQPNGQSGGTGYSTYGQPSGTYTMSALPSYSQTAGPGSVPRMDPWLFDTYWNLPVLQGVRIVPHDGGNPPILDTFGASTIRSIYCGRQNKEYLSNRLFDALTTVGFDTYRNPSQAHPDQIEGTTEFGVVYFRIPRQLSSHIRQNLPSRNACFLSTGIAAYSHLITPYASTTNHKTIEDRRIGLYPVEYEYQRGIAFLGTVANMSSVQYAFGGGALHFVTRTKEFSDRSFARGLPSGENFLGLKTAGDHSDAIFNIVTQSFPHALNFGSFVPVFDARDPGFTFDRLNFSSLLSLPLYDNEVPHGALITVGYTTCIFQDSQADTVNISSSNVAAANDTSSGFAGTQSFSNAATHGLANMDQHLPPFLGSDRGAFASNLSASIPISTSRTPSLHSSLSSHRPIASVPDSLPTLPVVAADIMLLPLVGRTPLRRANSLGWTLKEVTGNGRSLILIFNECILKFSYLTHTSPQFLSEEMWYKSIMFTTGEQRGYKVALALQFEGGDILAFLSHDLLFQIEWLTPNDTRINAPLPHSSLKTVDVFENFYEFLRALAAWITTRRRSGEDRTGLACEVMREDEGAKCVWVGVGVYTVCELFFLAGLSIFLNEREVFDNASRTARLANAFWQFAYNAQDIYVTCISPCLVENVLAPTKDQRMYYSKYLNVFKKDKTKVPTRMADAINAFETRLFQLAERSGMWRRDDEAIGLYDYFEPSLMANALLLKTCRPDVDVTSSKRESTTPEYKCRKCRQVPCDAALKIYSLGGLCLGSADWRSMAPKDVLALEDVILDPLTKCFNRAYRDGVITKQDRFCTFLRPGAYSQGIVPDDARYKKLRVKVPILYKLIRPSRVVALYSIVWIYPANSAPDSEHAKQKISMKAGTKIIRATTQQTVKAMFRNIVKTDGLVSIGPLEYRGNGIPLTHAKKTYVSLVRDGDPRLPSHLHLRTAMKRSATRVIRAVQRARKKRVSQKARIKAMLAEGKKPKARTITVALHREKERKALRKELDAKVLAVEELGKDLRDAYKMSGRMWTGKVTPMPPSKAAQMAAIPDLPSPTLSRSPSPGLGSDYEFDFSPPNTPPATSRAPSPSPPSPLSPPSPPPTPKPKKKRYGFDQRLAAGMPTYKSSGKMKLTVTARVRVKAVMGFDWSSFTTTILATSVPHQDEWNPVILPAILWNSETGAEFQQPSGTALPVLGCRGREYDRYLSAECNILGERNLEVFTRYHRRPLSSQKGVHHCSHHIRRIRPVQNSAEPAPSRVWKGGGHGRCEEFVGHSRLDNIRPGITTNNGSAWDSLAGISDVEWRIGYLASLAFSLRLHRLRSECDRHDIIMILPHPQPWRVPSSTQDATKSYLQTQMCLPLHTLVQVVFLHQRLLALEAPTKTPNFLPPEQP